MCSLRGSVDRLLFLALRPLQSFLRLFLAHCHLLPSLQIRPTNRQCYNSAVAFQMAVDTSSLPTTASSRLLQMALASSKRCRLTVLRELCFCQLCCLLKRLLTLHHQPSAVSQAGLVPSIRSTADRCQRESQPTIIANHTGCHIESK